MGSGDVASLSVSTRQSKFGMVCPATEGGAEREAVLALLVEHDFITCVHVHTGSGGMTLAQMAEGAATIVAVAQAANTRRPASSARIDTIDIGGGLPCRWRNQRLDGHGAAAGAGTGGGDGRGQFELYADTLAQAAPALFDGTFRRVLTEFGATLNCDFGVFAWLVEVGGSGRQRPSFVCTATRMATCIYHRRA
eukprot:COSAG01_NODE_1120_length_11632_cov_50.655770_4_plen_194_part_00